MFVATIFLFAFFPLEAPTILEESADRWVPLGRTNDALIGLASLAGIPLGWLGILAGAGFVPVGTALVWTIISRVP